jgi:hemolysin activation/secretion protein
LRLEPLVHVPQRLLEQMLARGQAPGEILNIDALESATLVANDLPGLKVSSVLAAGRQAGQTDILVKVEPTALLTGNASADNLDPRSTGETKLTTNLGLNNAFGVGDQLTLTAQATTGKAYTNLSGSLPLAAGGQRIALNASTLQYRLQGSFAATGAHGSSDVAGANLSWPLLRSQTTNVQAQLAYSHAHLRSDADAGNLSDKSEQSLTLGLNLNRSDEWGGGGVTLAGWSLVGGALDLSANPDSLAQDRAGAGTQGRFYKLTWNAARLQQLPAGAQLWLSASGQAAFNNLDSGQKFSLGGASGVRAYPALEASGDDGTQLTVEVRRALRAGWMGKLFYDWGNVLQSHDGRGAAASVPNRYALQGWGVGLDWSPMARVSLRAVLAQRIGSNPAAQPGTGHDSDGTLHTVQTWLTANVDF